MKANKFSVIIWHCDPCNRKHARTFKNGMPLGAGISLQLSKKSLENDQTKYTELTGFNLEDSDLDAIKRGYDVQESAGPFGKLSPDDEFKAMIASLFGDPRF
jgi:hypothetical protein